MSRITPFLWFDGEAEAAAKFYVSIFPKSRIGRIARYDAASAAASGRKKGSVMTVSFTLDGQGFVALNGGPLFRFTEAVSFVVACRTQKEIDAYWSKLTKGGEPSRCGWLKDRFGLSWQVVPDSLDRLLSGPDPKKSARAMQALLGMTKIDVAALKRAHAGK